MRLSLGTHEQHNTPLSHNVTDGPVCNINLPHSLLQINDVNAVAFRKDERTHFRMPTAGTVSKMDTSFQQRLH